MLKAYYYRLYPNKEQEVLFNKHFGCTRFIYNWALELKIKNYIKKKKSLSVFDIKLKLPKMKKKLKWLKEINSQSLQQALLNLDKAFTSFFRDHKGFPKFKSRKDRQSFQCPQNVKVDFKHNKISFPKIQNVKIKLSRQFVGEVRTVTVSKSKSGKFYVSVLVNTKESISKKPKININKTIGIDLGLKDFCITSNGEKISNPRFNRNIEKKIAKLNQKMAKQKKMNKNKHTKNRERTRIRLAKLYEYATNQRQDFLHKLSSRLISENQTICLEDLNVAGMLKNHKVAKSISDVSWSSFVNMLKYKSEWYGKNLIFIGRFDPSSKMCSCCGKINNELTLKDREWKCLGCGTEHDRDINAAKNIKNFALQRQNLIGKIPPDRRESTLQEIEACKDRSLNEESTPIYRQ